MIQLLWLWLQSFIIKAFNKEEEVGVIIREEEVEVIIIILEVLTIMVTMSITINFRISTKAIQDSLLGFKTLIKLSNPIRTQDYQAGLHAKSVAKVAIQPLIATIEWTLHTKAGIHLQNWLPWWLMLLKFKLPMLGSLTQVAQTM